MAADQLHDLTGLVRLRACRFRASYVASRFGGFCSWSKINVQFESSMGADRPLPLGHCGRKSYAAAVVFREHIAECFIQPLNQRGRSTEVCGQSDKIKRQRFGVRDFEP